MSSSVPFSSFQKNDFLSAVEEPPEQPPEAPEPDAGVEEALAERQGVAHAQPKNNVKQYKSTLCKTAMQMLSCSVVQFSIFGTVEPG